MFAIVMLTILWIAVTIPGFGGLYTAFILLFSRACRWFAFGVGSTAFCRLVMTTEVLLHLDLDLLPSDRITTQIFSFMLTDCEFLLITSTIIGLMFLGGGIFAIVVLTNLCDAGIDPGFGGSSHSLSICVFPDLLLVQVIALGVWTLACILSVLSITSDVLDQRNLGLGLLLILHLSSRITSLTIPGLSLA
jgi:hypothetical protein